MAYNKAHLIERLRLNSEVSQNGCWLWSKYINKNGYGEFPVYKEKGKLAHRWSYRLFYDDFNPELLVCHRCDTRNCVNPAHLFQGTKLDNNQDRKLKGRNADKRGSKHHRAKLREGDIWIIKELYSRGFPQTGIAELYEVNQSVISTIVNQKAWTHV